MNKEKIECKCTECTNEFRVNTDELDSETQCPECESWIDVHEAVILHRVGNSNYVALAEGPKTRDELGHISGATSYGIEKLKPPSQRQGKEYAKLVYYLPGDEREAMRHFIEVNEKYIRECMNLKHNPLNSSWSEWGYDLFLEQWYWNGWDLN